MKTTVLYKVFSRLSFPGTVLGTRVAHAPHQLSCRSVAGRLQDVKLISIVRIKRSNSDLLNIEYTIGITQ